MKMLHSRDKSCTDATAELNFEYLVRDRQIYKDDCDNSTLAPHLMNEFEEKSSSSSSNSCCSGDYLNMVADEYSLAESHKIVYNSVITESDALSNSNKQVDQTIINDGILSSEFLSFVGEFKTFRQLEKLTSGQSIDVNLNYAIDPCLSRSSNEDCSSHIDNAKHNENEHVTGELSSPLSFDEENSSIPTVSSYQTGLIITDSFDTIPVTNTSNPRQTGQGNFEQSDVCSFDVTKMLDMATEQFKRAQYNSALGIYEHLLKIHISENGYHQESVASTLHQIATCHIRSGRYTVAQPFIEEAVRLKMTLNGNNHQEVAHSLQKLGMILISNKNFGGALQILHRSLRIYRSEISNKCPETLDAIFKIGCVHFQINEYMAALMAFEEALEIDIFLRDSNNDYSKSIEKIDILSHIGFVKIKLKQYGDAIIFFQEALEVSVFAFCFD
jgi:hypothetical protein